MLDMPLRRLAQAPLHMIAAALAPLISANMLTVFGFIVGLFCFSALAGGAWLVALPLLILNRLIDALDGPVAQHSATGPTRLGGYLDLIADFTFYGGFVFFFALGAPHHALAASFLIFCFLVCAASFIASTLIPAPVPGSTFDPTLGSPARRNRIFNPQLIESTETTLFFALMCLLPFAFTPLAAILGLLTLATAAINVGATYDQHIKAQRAALLNTPPPQARTAPSRSVRSELRAALQTQFTDKSAPF